MIGYLQHIPCYLVFLLVYPLISQYLSLIYPSFSSLHSYPYISLNISLVIHHFIPTYSYVYPFFSCFILTSPYFSLLLILFSPGVYFFFS